MSPPRQGDRVDRGTNRASVLSTHSRSVDGVDTRNDIREFLISRRAKITPEQAGLPAYGGKRRVAGLRLEEVAMLAGSNHSNDGGASSRAGMPIVRASTFQQVLSDQREPHEPSRGSPPPEVLPRHRP
jgi:hypothetical protein